MQPHPAHAGPIPASFTRPWDGVLGWNTVIFGVTSRPRALCVSQGAAARGVRGGLQGLLQRGITLVSSQAVSNAKKMGWPLKEITSGVFETEAPGGYKFYLEDKEKLKHDPVWKVTLGVSDLQKSVSYWSGLLGMKIYEKDEEKQRALLGYADNQCKLELQAVGGAVDHGTAFGRIAFSCAKDELPNIEALMKRENQRILTPLVSLDTPGKATVQVVILADPDGHEICFVGDEAFRELSKVDPNGDKLLDDAMAADNSDKWFAEHNMKKVSA
uniref:Glyoxalase domain containing 4 n=1 Tax=Ficedula albicollis TaxID=59894 RepID=A0A803VXZ8_FICAL